MSKRFFQKYNARIFLLDKESKPIPFERLAENHGAIALDPSNKAHAAMIEAIDDAILKGIGGVLELKDEAAYLELKKKLDPSLERPRRLPGIRIADQNPIPAMREPSLPPADGAVAPGVVGRAEDSTPVRPATEQGKSSGESPNALPPGINGGRGHRVRTAKVEVSESGEPKIVSSTDGAGDKPSAE